MAAKKMNLNAQPDVLEVLYKHPCGYIKNLEDELGENTVHQLEAIGYIVNAPSEEGYTYRISNKAKQIVSGLSEKRSIRDLLSDMYYRYVKRVHFSVQ
ncbi:MAG: hypothetical protein IKO26_04350 [Paludibacteraceae bacterium]|nr:hypothetical protein [Paludibacteraceae bacterium]